MRKFDYRKDYGIVSSTIKEYINTLKSDVEWLYKNEKKEQYMDALIQINEFIKKYPNFHDIHEKILDDLLTPENVEYCFKNNVYKKDASKLGVEFQKDLEKIIELEEKLKKLAIEKWKKDLTPFEKIENGEDFMIVGHASYHLPGVYGDNNYHTGPHSRQFISCLLLSDKELNTFYNHRIVYITKVNEENYICSASFDSVTSEDTIPNFLTVGEIKENEQTHYIKSGFTYGGKVNTTISTPKRIEIESIKREIETTGEMYNYNALTNEIVLDRSKTKRTGALLISNGCDLLLSEYWILKENNIPFKCINRGLYREKKGYTNYTKEEYEEFIKKIEIMPEQTKKINPEFLKSYYEEVVLKMNYSQEIVEIIKRELSKYVELDIKKNTK